MTNEYKQISLMDNEKMMQIFEDYEAKFGVWLYSAWDFDSVDWKGLAKEAEKCIQDGNPMTDEVTEKFLKQLDDGKIY